MSTKTLIEKKSNKNFEETYITLKNTLEANPNLKILLELDHSKNAVSVDLELLPTRIILFGNPKLGTVLMKDNQTVGIDLPQKILLMEKDGIVKIIYNNPIYLKERHQLSNATAEVLQKVSTALDTVTNIAIGA
ncbi:DUF302 domain-containing protein [uncultured Croceitalea sp.]|uniref:DUF302 domain-containing protein n=1 Tax=uncultured Croceitalea sp. TaxID=1798908 RepID=UPI00374F2D59